MEPMCLLAVKQNGETLRFVRQDLQFGKIEELYDSLYSISTNILKIEIVILF